MKRILSLTLIVAFLASISFWNIVYWVDDAPTMTHMIRYTLYEYNVTTFCAEYKNTQNTTEFIYLTDESNVYPNLDKESWTWKEYIAEAKELYRKNMDSIYWCATSIVNLRALKKIRDELLVWDKELTSRIRARIDERIAAVEKAIAESQDRCKVSSAKDDNIIKKAVLNQTIYEYCKYAYYLMYLQEYTESRYWMIQLDTWTGSLINDYYIWTIDEALNTAIQNANMVNKEITDSEKAFPVAFKAYSEYENNLIVHILLELLLEDFIVLREKLHQNINPINQVVYKLSNAMRQ